MHKPSSLCRTGNPLKVKRLDARHHSLHRRRLTRSGRFRFHILKYGGKWHGESDAGKFAFTVAFDIIKHPMLVGIAAEAFHPPGVNVHNHIVLQAGQFAVIGKLIAPVLVGGVVAGIATDHHVGVKTAIGGFHP
jgi:hypothetical protein